MASDLISRDAVLNIVDNEWYKYKDKDGLFEIAACTLMKSLFDDVERIEAVDAVEVVRCKDCAHKRNEGPILRCPYSTVDLMPGGYCDKGLPNAMREVLQNIKKMEKKKVSF